MSAPRAARRGAQGCSEVDGGRACEARVSRHRQPAVFPSTSTRCLKASASLHRANLSELARENAWSRIYLVPAILAEQDRDEYRRSQAALAREKEIMKDVEGWEVSSRAQMAALGEARAVLCLRAAVSRGQADNRPASRSTTRSGIPPAPLPCSKRQNVFMATAAIGVTWWRMVVAAVVTACGVPLTHALMV